MAGHLEDQEAETETAGQEEATAPPPPMAVAPPPLMAEDSAGAGAAPLEDHRQTMNRPKDPYITLTTRSKGTAVGWRKTNAG